MRPEITDLALNEAIACTPYWSESYEIIKSADARQRRELLATRETSLRFKNIMSGKPR
jgi:hypothetical protein